jgi:hypothetical protein
MDKKAEYNKLVTQWQGIIKRFHGELAQKMTELELSSLYACIPDCFESVYEIYYEIMPALLRTPPEDYDKLHDHIFDIGGLPGALSSLKHNISAAEPGFLQFINLLAAKADQQEKYGQNKN